MATEIQPTLIDLDDANLKLANPLDDIRGQKVFDRNGDEIGDIDSLVVDERENTVRFLRIGSGGFLGMGKTKRLVPVDAITRRESGTVHIDRTRGTVADSSPYDPELVHAPEFYAGLYGYYGYVPFWAPEYTHPDRPQ
ncbi:PRC-barrel domain-containing protein (plasmid) [Rhodococcus opacus]|uniref:PRC-barrel domain-containing protein n=1 Tax=Rhodococcus opacus TaxID=37919 RepID=UPI0034D35FF5